MRGQLTFISGGVRSGKSAFAEKQLVASAREAGGRLVYIASGQAVDKEMHARIEQHQHDRADQQWTTIEQPVSLENVLPLIQPNDFVLWDCLTTWLANELYEKQQETYCIHSTGCMEKKAELLLETIEKFLERASRFTIVSNEVLDELPSPFTETQQYGKWIGSLHQQIVHIADDAIEMDYGLPFYWKKEGQVTTR